MRLLIFCFALIHLASVAQSNTDRLNRLLDDGKFSEAIQEVDILLNEKSNNEFDLRNRKAFILISMGDFKGAENTLNELNSGALSDFQKAVISSTKGFLLLNKGNFDESLDNLNKAQHYFSKSGKENSTEAAQNLSFLGQLYSSTGKYKQAEDNQLMSLQIREKIFPKDHPSIAASYNDLGFVYSFTDADKALQYYEMALPIYKKIFGETHAKVAVATTNIGAMYNRLELYGDAQNNFETALNIWKKLYPNGHPNQALVLISLGRTYAKLNNLKATKAYFKLALSQYQKAYGAKHPDLASCYNELGTLLRGENKFDSSLYFFQQALNANSNSFNTTDIKANPSAKSPYNGMVMLYSVLGKSQTLEEKYINKTIKQSDLILSLKCLQSSDTLVDLLRQNSRDESDKIALGALSSEVYENGVRVSYLLSEVTTKPSYYKELAFNFAEKSKSAVLLESIADANAKSFAGIPQDLVEQEKSLKAEIAINSQKLAQRPDPSQEQEIRKTLFSLNGSYESLIKKLEKDFPDYFNLKYINALPTPRSIQTQLPKGTAIVSYFIADYSETKRLYIFTLTNKRFNIISRSLPERLDRLMKGFNNALFFSDATVFWQTGSTLSKLLNPDLPKSIIDIVIIPAGRLGTMPFEALPLSKETKQDFGNEFWINRYSIGYEFSTSLLAKKSSKKESTSNSIYLCAPIQFSSQNLNDLPGTEAEVNFIAGLFGDKVSLKKSNDATETNVKQASLKDYRYIHFATHGIVDEESPELSRIYLKASDKDDGDLFSGEIYNLQLNADMVALSACQTGLGKVSKGEGVIGLSRALVYAGAKNILVSYWSVSDESTSQMMQGFYQNILKTSTPSYRKSLQSVKMKLIAEKKYGAPFYWAPFVLIGF